MLTYVVNDDADDLDGWTSAQLARDLEAPLRALGVDVENRPRESGLGGTWGWADPDLVQVVKAVVDRVVTGGVA